ncbi:MAG: helix-turn-helix transcriptional regulator [Bacteroidales bacterium]|nr:helix-turn-helix transcriptional regulator [Bacteroidales bacterium]
MLNIKDALKRHGYTQRMVAKKLGMSEMNVSQIVNGNPTYNKMQAVADAIGADITEFFQSDTASLICPHCGKPITICIKGE